MAHPSALLPSFQQDPNPPKLSFTQQVNLSTVPTTPRKPSSPKTPAFLKFFYCLLLLPTLYVLHAYLIIPLSGYLGNQILNLSFPSDPSYFESSIGQNEGHWLGKREIKKGTAVYAVFAALIPILVILSGIFAGLTLGYMSLDLTQITILATSGNPKQQQHAKAIYPVRKNGHQLLTTLLLANMVVNETLPVISDPILGGGVQAVVVSTVLIIIFAEIIPQSICSRYGLLVGAKAAPLVRVIMFVLWPIAFPVAWLLEKILGNHNGIIYRKGELRELLNLHAQAGTHGGDLLNSTVIMAQGALDLQDKVVKDAMTPIDNVFMLEDNTKLDYEVLSKVVQSGHSRIPVYKNVEVPDLTTIGKTRVIKKILGTMLVKNCVLLDPEDATPISSIPINTTFPSVPQDEPLLNMLNAFREGGSHMAIVSRRNRRVVNIGDEDSVDHESIIGAAALGLRERIRRKLVRSDSSSDESEEDDLEMGSVGKQAKKEERKKKAEAERKQTKKEGQGTPGDAQLPTKAVNQLMIDMEGESVGIITLEDVLEELIGDEIEDEYDQQDEAGNAVTAFIPAEAQIHLDRARQNLVITSANAPPYVIDTSKPTSDSAPKKTISGNFASKLGGLGTGLGDRIRRTSSAPGRKRTAEDPAEGAGSYFASAGGTPPHAASGTASPTAPTAAPEAPIEDEKESNQSGTEVGTDIDEKKEMTEPTRHFSPPFNPDSLGVITQSPLTSPSLGPPAKSPFVSTTPPASSNPTPVVPTPAALAEALERGRKRTLILGSFNGPNAGRSSSIPGTGTSTPVGSGSGVGGIKKKVFKSNPSAHGGIASGSPTLSGQPLVDEPKGI